MFCRGGWGGWVEGRWDNNVRLLCVLCARRSSLALAPLAHMRDVTLGDLLWHLHTFGMLRQEIFLLHAHHLHTCGMLRPFGHMRDVMLGDFLLHLHTWGMLRWRSPLTLAPLAHMLGCDSATYWYLDTTKDRCSWLQTWGKKVTALQASARIFIRAGGALFLENAAKPSRVAHFWQGAQVLAPATRNGIWMSKSGPGLSIFFCTVDLDMCFAPQRRTLFRHLNVQGCSEPGVL